jgi:hypothetical protein
MESIGAMNTSTPPKPAVDLDALTEEQLLDMRIRDLPLRLDGTWLADRVGQLHRELRSNGIAFEPVCYLADEWLTPEDEPVIGIPFYLAHPRLIALQKKFMFEAEGETSDWCMKLLRHETGHALSYAYRLHERRDWQKIFGSSSQAYEDTYRYRPYSKSFVRHLDYYYAQYHPDEDFSETFAVWLTPGLDWRKQYRGWKALDKLHYVEQLMKEIAGQPPIVAKGGRYWRADKIRSTLRRHYSKLRKAEAESRPEFHDTNLRRMFPEGKARDESRLSIARILQQYRKPLLSMVSSWTHEKRYMVNGVYKAVYQRAKALRLVTEDPEAIAMLQLSTYLTTLMMNYRYSNKLGGKTKT